MVTKKVHKDSKSETNEFRKFVNLNLRYKLNLILILVTLLVFAVNTIIYLQRLERLNIQMLSVTEKTPVGSLMTRKSNDKIMVLQFKRDTFFDEFMAVQLTAALFLGFIVVQSRRSEV